MWPEGAHDITATTKRPLTAGTIFKNSMSALMTILASKEPFYVRCIKPNEIKSPSTINDQRVIHQISYLGLLENVRVRRAGFAFRRDYGKFVLRYKMLCKDTWPNPRGSDRDGTQAILKSQNLDGDVTYGKTKIFIKSPETVFHLEEVRERKLPELIIFLQKMVRGTLARRRAKKMAAALKIGLYFRHYKLRTYVDQLHKTFKNAKQMRDYGKSLQWPEPPKTLSHLRPLFNKAFHRWRAFMVLSKHPRETWEELHMKITAIENLRGKRATWGIERSWNGDYLNNTSDNVDVHFYRDSLKKEGASKVAFSCKTIKFNRHGKVTERALVITTDDRIFKMDPKKKFKTMLKYNLLSDFSKLSISPDGNQIAILHLNQGNDLVFSLTSNDDKIGELVAILSSRLEKANKGKLNIVVSNNLSYNSGKNSKTLSVNSKNTSGTFIKSNTGATFQ